MSVSVTRRRWTRKSANQGYNYTKYPSNHPQTLHAARPRVLCVSTALAWHNPPPQGPTRLMPLRNAKCKSAPPRAMVCRGGALPFGLKPTYRSGIHARISRHSSCYRARHTPARHILPAWRRTRRGRAPPPSLPARPRRSGCAPGCPTCAGAGRCRG